MDFNFTDKVVLITGSAQGMGKVEALEFAKRGANVVLVDLNAEKMAQVAEECRNLGSKKVLELVCDLQKTGEIESIPERLKPHFDKLHVLVNNAGIFCAGNLNEIESHEFDAMINVNLKAPLFLIKSLMPMLEKAKGAVVNISSLCSSIVTPGLLIYSISKAGVDHMTKLVAHECAKKGVRVNSVNPAVANNPLPEKEEDRKGAIEFRSQHEAYQPLGGLIEPLNVARLVMFLSSDLAKQITGRSHVIDAGHLLEKEAATPSF